MSRRYNEEEALERGEVTLTSIHGQPGGALRLLDALHREHLLRRTSKGHHYWVSPSVIEHLQLGPDESSVAATLTPKDFSVHPGYGLRRTGDVLARVASAYGSEGITSAFDAKALALRMGKPSASIDLGE